MSDKENCNKRFSLKKVALYLLFGAIIGLGAVLPGISGGVLCVIFGIYRPIMDLMTNPIKTLKSQAIILVPTVIGMGIGFLAISKLLGFLLNRFPDYSVCLFVGLIFGMLPSLFQEAGAQGRRPRHDVSYLLGGFLVIFTLLEGLKLLNVHVTLNFGWSLFSGFCAALSIIIPGLSFSTFLIPLGLYDSLLNSITALNDFSVLLPVLLPVALGGIVTVLTLSRVASHLMKKHYAATFHAIIGVVIAATVVIIPFPAFIHSWSSCLICCACFIVGAAISLGFSKLDIKKD